MTIGLILAALAVQAGAPAAVATTVPAPPPVAAWAGLPDVPYLRRFATPDTLSTFVRAEITAGRCTVAPDAAALPIELVVFIDRTGTIRRIAPRAIGCPTVEQYASGLVLRYARDNLIAPATPVDAWYHAAFTFALK